MVVCTAEETKPAAPAETSSKKEQGGNWIVDAAIEAGLEYVDKRAHGGSLWIIGDRSLDGFMSEMEARGASFRFREGGGKSTKGKDAWWLK